eukprot:767146-Hanusia_phi.AAC.4
MSLSAPDLTVYCSFSIHRLHARLISANIMERGSRDNSQQAASSARKDPGESKRGRKEVLKDLSSSDAALLFNNSWLG